MYGTLDQQADRWQLRFVRTFAHPPEKVWRAITAPEHLRAWFPARIDGERAAGAPLRFVFEHDDGPPLDGEMLTYDPPTLLEFRWDADTFRIELRAAEGAATEMTFLCRFDELGRGARDAAGWHTCLDRLAHHLDGDQPPWTDDDRWQQVHPHYVATFGPEASTIGPLGR